MRGLDQLWSIDPTAFVLLVCTVSVEVIGIVQAIKKYCKKPTVIIAFIICCVCGIMQTSFIPFKRITSAFNIVMCSFSIVTLCAQAMIGALRALPDLIVKRLEK